MTDLAEIKRAARKAAGARRKRANLAETDAAARAAAVFLAGITAGQGAIVSGYRPIHSELDPTPLLEELHAQGLRLCMPVIPGKDRPLLFREWTPGCAMEVGAFGAEIPRDGVELEPTLLIVPLLAFDRRLYRLGYGGGFYDRTLERLRDLRPTRAYGFAYAAQEMAEVPIEPTDQRLDGVVTPEGLIA